MKSQFIKTTLLAGLMTTLAWSSHATEPLRLTYLANAGAMVEQGESKVLFDPLFRITHGYYRSLPDHMENSLLSAQPPFDGVDLVLVSHIHLDHFSPNLMLDYLLLNPEVQVIVPAQALDAMQQFASGQESAMLERITALNLSHYGSPMQQQVGDMLVEILRIPHSGWPDENRSTQNLVYRVTFKNGISVVHLGDSAGQEALFARFNEFWPRRTNHLVLAPVWLMQQSEGLAILQGQLSTVRTLGMHVPAAIPEQDDLRAREYRGLELLVTPGQTLVIGGE